MEKFEGVVCSTLPAPSHHICDARRRNIVSHNVVNNVDIIGTVATFGAVNS